MGLLLEKVTAQLHKDGSDNQAADVRGLTQVEARIVVLSVLWKIRENYRSGDNDSTCKVANMIRVVSQKYIS